MDDTLRTNLLGLVGVILNTAVSWAPLKAILTARKAGGLGGLDSKYWPIWFLNNTLWLFYSTYLGDVWLFLSTWIPAAMWLFFCFTAVELLMQEEGELQLTTGTSQKASLHRSKSVINRLAEASRAYRARRIKTTEIAVNVGIFLLNLLCFIFLSPNVQGFLVITASMKLTLFTALCALSSTIQYGIPILRIYFMCKACDASSIHVSMCLAGCVNCATWCGYGISSMNYSIYVPNSIGVSVLGSQLIMCLAFRASRLESKDSSFASDEATPPVPATCTAPPGSAEPDLEAYEDYLRWQKFHLKQRNSCCLESPDQAPSLFKPRAEDLTLDGKFSAKTWPVSLTKDFCEEKAVPTLPGKILEDV